MEHFYQSQSQHNEVYRGIFEEIKKIIENNNKLNDIADFDSLKKLGSNDNIKTELWGLLTGIYKNETEVAKLIFEDKDKYDTIIKEQNYIIDDDGILLNNLKTIDNTMKRQMEIDLNEFRKIQYNLTIIKQSIIFVAIILIIPALVKFKVIDKKMGLMIWFVLLIVLLIYIIFMIVIKNSNRDDINFKEYNFVKPTDEEIARSRIAAASMSDKDKVKCRALANIEEDYDTDSINIDITKYKTKEDNKCPL